MAEILLAEAHTSIGDGIAFAALALAIAAMYVAYRMTGGGK